MSDERARMDDGKLRRYLKKVTAELRDVHHQLREIEQDQREPIAIVGMSCRYPGGVCSPEGLWELVAAGGDAISAFPADRGWDLERLYDPDPDRAGCSYARHGGFVHDAGDFDAEFFGISPREALAMDPQQRLLLEGGWEAVESAGIDPSSLRGSDTGVFAGIMHQDYAPLVGSGLVPEGLEGYVSTGNGAAVASGRLAYVLGLEGPAVSVDTACSSSLVALHLACQALRAGECSLALAGGVTVLSTPAMFIEFSRQRVLSVDGRCRAFAAGADGLGWAEGMGVVVVERLSRALREGHGVLAVVRGSAVNQDGASNGLTAPNGPSQERVIRQALASAGVTAGEVDAVEAHGTGTALGDPIEAQALLATYGVERVNGPLWLGSLKSNIGHAVAAAGVGGVIKMVMALRGEELPQTLYAGERSPHVDWSMGAVELLTESVPWPRGERPRRAGVSSFGISGTNAHMILEEAPLEDRESLPTLAVGGEPGWTLAVEGEPRVGADQSPGTSGAGASPVVPWLLSAKSEPALRAQAERLRSHLLRHPQLAPTDVAFTLAGRATFEHRGVVVGADRDLLLVGLEALARGEPAAGMVKGWARSAGKVAFMFPGQGSQWKGMAAELLDSSPVFANQIEACARALDPFLGWSLEELLRGSPDAPALDRVDVVQPALFAVMLALAALWRSHGVEPAMVVGHSQGEIAAAHVAGALTLNDAARVVALRSRALAGLAGRGGMVSVSLPAQQVAELLRRWDGRISVAAFNGPGSVVVSGPTGALEELIEWCEAQEIRARRIAVDYASHSPQIEGIRASLAEALAPVAPGCGEIPIYSTASNEVLDGSELDAGYWYRSLRQPVRFEAAIRALLRDGFTTFIEVSPHPVLTTAVLDTIEATGADPDGVVAIEATDADPDGVAAIGTLRRDEGGLRRFTVSLAELHVHGRVPNWGALCSAPAARRVDLPTYAFQRERFWLEAAAGAGDLAAVGQAEADHPLLGAAVELPEGGGWLFTGRLSLRSHPWLADHAVFGTVLLPGTAFLELALHAAGRVELDTVEELTLEAPLVLGEGDAVALRVAVAEADDRGAREVTISSRRHGEEEDAEWTRHAGGILAAGGAGMSGPPAGAWLPAGTWPPEGATALDPAAAVYGRLAELGFDYGPAFQGLTAIWRRGEEIFAEVALDRTQAAEAGRFGVHPALLDASFHPAIETFTAALGQSRVPLPFSFRGVRLERSGAAALRVAIVPTGVDTLRLAATDTEGTPVLAIDSLVTRPVEPSQLADARRLGASTLLGLDWIEIGPLADGEPRRLAAVGDEEVPGVEHRYADPRALAEALDGGAEPPNAVLAPAPGADGDCTAAAVHASVQRTLELLQGWLAEPRLADTPLVVVTRGAVAAVEGDELDLTLAPLWGLVRSAQAEHPGRFATVDLDDADASLAALPAALGIEEPQLALRRGAALVPRLAPISTAPEGERRLALDPEGTVLITGGTGGLGGLLARHLVQVHRARRLLLTSRRGEEAQGAAELQSELRELGAEVTIAACDVAERAQVQALLDSIPREHPLDAVVHAAGVLDDGVIESLTADQVERVLRPKVDAALHLHELTAGLELEAFVMYSSAAPLLGGPGQGNYAAANAFLDALAQHRRAHGLAGRSLAWGLWTTDRGAIGGSGASTIDERLRADMGTLVKEVADPVRFIEQIRARLGLLALQPADGLALFDAAMNADRALLVPVRLDGVALRSQARAGRLPALLRGLVRVPARRGSDMGGSLAERLVGVAEVQRDAVVLEVVRSAVAAVLGYDSQRSVETGRAFKELGFDSLTAVELRNRLNATTGLRLPSTLVFDHPTPAAVAAFLRSQVEGVARCARPAAPRRVRLEEPIAIVGMSCRYPGGVCSPEGLWELVAAGGDAISAFPADRGWDLERLYDPDPDRAGCSYARHGGFVHDAGDFDAEFFGISPREALAMDPQQRLLLEGGWEAVESAGIDPSSLRGSDTGVFAGIMHQDYAPLVGSGLVPEGLEGYVSTGNGAAVASGRLAYVLGLEGPAVSVDTACSSSLVALHLACQALRAGECSLALAGGVTVLSTPAMFIEFARQRGLAADGRCKAFGAGADGIGCAEGMGVVVVERLSRALREGHGVLAVVRGSAVNQDGASNGLTAPNGPSQERVIRQALASAGVTAAEVDAVEAHGTGTSLGDPIEAQALLATYGAERVNGPLWLGSLKSNIGHAVAAAGVGGVIKMVMALRGEELPRTLYAGERSPHVDWSAGAVELLTESVPWPRGERPRRAGVSSFGISGTNAHMILEEAPPEGRESLPTLAVDGEPGWTLAVEGEPRVGADQSPGTPGAGASPVVPWLLSAKSEPALRAQAERLRSHLLCHPQLAPTDVAFTLASARARLQRCAAVVGEDRDQLLVGLEALARGEPAAGVVRGVAGEGKTAFMFTGQGAQRPGMGAGLYASFPVFGAALDVVCAELDAHLGRSLRELMFAGAGTDEAALLDRTEFTQPALFALEVALYRLVEAFGVLPDYLVGHSIGELVAAHVAGVLSLPDACKLVAARGRLMGALPKGGAMLAVEAAEEEIAASLGSCEGSVSIAAVNGPCAVVVSGDAEAIAALESHFVEAGRRTTRLRVGHAFHSSLMEPMLDEFGRVAAELTFHPPAIPIVSNVTGTQIDDDVLAAPGYWVRHVREAVRFADGIATLEQAGVTRFLELGPDGVLAMLASRCLSPEAAERALLTQTLRRKRAEAKTLVGFLAAAHAAGLSVDWEVLFAGREACRVDLPTYAFQREHFWLERSVAAVDAGAVGQVGAGHPLLGAVVELPEGGGWLFTGRVSLGSHGWLVDHAVFGVVVLPGSVFLELALHAAGCVGLGVVEELVLEAPLVLPERGAVQLRVWVGALDRRGARRLTISSRLEGEGSGFEGEDAEWTRHADGELAAGVVEGGRRLVGVWPQEGAQALELAGLGVGGGLDFAGVVYGRLAELGFEYGPVFRGLGGVWRRGEEVFAEVALGGGQVGEAGRFGLHPALLDAALHAGLLAAVEAGEEVGLPFVWGGVVLHASGAAELRVRITRGAEGLSLVAFDGAGELVVEVGSLGVRAVDPGRLGLAGGGDSLFGVDWVGVPVAGGDESVTEGVASGGVATLGALVVPGGDGSVPGDVGAGGVATLGELVVPGAGCYPDLAGLLDSLGERGGAPGVVVVEFAGEGGGVLPGGAHIVLKRVLLLLQGWLGEPRLAGARLVVLTRGAVCAVEGDEPDLGLAALWGLLRSARSEHPGRFALVDLDGDEASLGVLPTALACDEPELAIREGVVLAPRLTPVSRPTPVPQTVAVSRLAPVPLLASVSRPTAAGGERPGFGFDPRRTVLLTGGTGGLGSLFASHLVRAHGVRRLLLVSRRGLDAPGAVELGRELEQLGARVTIAACDVAEREQLRVLLDSIPSEHSLGAVIHAAGVLEDGVIEGLTPERLDRVLAPKLDAAWHLHELSEAHDLDAFILFSSIASTIGVPGQANYAAANAFLDALAQHRHARHLPATTLAWGPWATDSGMTGSLSRADVARWSRAGVGSLSRVQGLELFDTARSVRRALQFAVRLDGVALRLRARGGGLPALLRGLVPAPARRGRGEEVSLAQRLVGMAGEERDAVVLEVVRSAVATVLAYDSAREVEMGRAFKELGFDSLTAVELRNRLSATTGLRLPSTLVFDHPTPAAVAEVVMRNLSPHGDVEGDRDPEELEVQSVLASIPLERLRASGLFDQLLELAALDGDRAPGVEGTPAAVDQLDAESLIRMSFDRGGSTGDPAGHR